MTSELTEKNVERFSSALDELEQAATFAKSMYQTDVYQEAGRLMETVEGMETLFSFAHRFDQAGVFSSGPWEDASKLQAPLVSGSLKSKGLASIIEVMSDMRMLAVAKGMYSHNSVTKDEAEEFLNEIMALNLDLLFPNGSEETRIEKLENAEQYDRAQRFFQFLFTQLSSSSLSKTLLVEINQLTGQRPIMVKRIISMIRTARKLLESEPGENQPEDLQDYIEAVEGPSPLSKRFSNINDYRRELKNVVGDELVAEANAFAESMQKTGIVAPHHAILLRALNKSKPELLSEALMLTDKGKANLEEHIELVKQLIKVAVYPATAQTIYGLSRMLDRGVLSSSPVAPGLRRLIELDIRPEVRKELFNAYEYRSGLTANSILVAGVISVLGQPLGVSQGLNPTCQSARGISLWAQHAPGYLLELIPRAARDGDIDLTFEGVPIHSKDLTGGLAPELHKELDPVSLVLVPHLDRIYNEMMVRVALRGEDGHKWVNPEFYGNWVQRGFSTVIEPITGTVSDYQGYVRLFYATHHPDYNDDYELIYPNPVGIFITNVHGKLLGFHAVSILRIDRVPSGDHRVYFYNPNNDGSQNWGQGIEPSVTGNGEREGESSLPFHEFVSRLYAFHYNPYEQGDAFAVEDDIVERIENLAKESWGAEYSWVNL
ncbi:hypothetical protein [Pseudalkalibacillus berkeleyi]|uniref:Uncharacterized protein n=1 Tax=Pseudalkalibacillus berkeleyi TaxID=1069813 RepID=A0ABS9H5T1_9BACL|nr:hypothetical protein [Pseudalkalibacillus berkeleyi]MCF6139207.1 hypothetical protein [Pseudalkalibacillus berkeleyi]